MPRSPARLLLSHVHDAPSSAPHATSRRVADVLLLRPLLLLLLLLALVAAVCVAAEDDMDIDRTHFEDPALMEDPVAKGPHSEIEASWILPESLDGSKLLLLRALSDRRALCPLACLLAHL